MACALLTGTSRGIGAALGQALLASGWRLLSIGRGETPSWLAAAGPKARHFDCDLASSEQIHNAAAQIDEPVDVLINNAAIFGNRAFHAKDFDPAAFLDTVAINLLAPTLLARLLRPRLAVGSRRLIIMMSTGNASLAGNVSGEMLAYRASKAALNQVVRTLAAEWGPDGFVCVALNPGWVRTDMGGALAPLTPTEAAARITAFIEGIVGPTLNGAFVNTDGSELPW